MKILDAVKTLLAPLLNVFTFNLQDSIKEVANRFVQSLLQDGLEQQANAIMEVNKTMELCAMIDTLVGLLIALLTLATTIGYFVINWETIQPKNQWLTKKWQALQNKFKKKQP
ncbi:MAG: hypothetical protein ACRBFS_08030 [Aureispira sp.]